ncbi:MAG: hypothetical protein ACFCU6_07255 [Balneolaceae bacterium]
MIQRIHHKISFGSLFILIVSLLPNSIFSQTIIGAKELAMGQAGVAIPESNWAIFSNPALIPDQHNQISLYALRYSGFSELTDLAAAASTNFSWGTTSIGLHRFGFDLFNETRLLLAYKNKFEHFHYGVVLNYTRVEQGGGYGTGSALGFNLGLAAEILPDLWVAARATNINQPAFGNSDEKLPRDLASGISYKPARILLLTFDVVKDVQFPVSVRSGFEIELVPDFFGRAGFSTEPVTYSLGFGYQPAFIGFNIAVQQHEVLGLSPGIDISIRF